MARPRNNPINNSYTPQSSETREVFGRWVVDEDGNMEFDNGRYYIEKERLREDDWICHLFEKCWIDWSEFIPAFFTACKINKIEHVKVRVFYKSAFQITKSTQSVTTP